MTEIVNHPAHVLRRGGRVDVLRYPINCELGEYDAGLINDLSPESEAVLELVTSPNNSFLDYHTYDDKEGHMIVSFFTGLKQEG